MLYLNLATELVYYVKTLRYPNLKVRRRRFWLIKYWYSLFKSVLSWKYIFFICREKFPSPILSTFIIGWIDAYHIFLTAQHIKKWREITRCHLGNIPWKCSARYIPLFQGHYVSCGLLRISLLRTHVCIPYVSEGGLKIYNSKTFPNQSILLQSGFPITAWFVAFKLFDPTGIFHPNVNQSFQFTPSLECV